MFSMLQNVSEDGVVLPILDRDGNPKINKQGKIIYKNPYKFAVHNDLRFTIYDTGTIFLEGSLHKYFNNGLYNFDDFDYNSFVSVLGDLEAKFGIKANNCLLQGIEIGTNIILPVPPKDILNSSFLHKTSAFKDVLTSSEGSYKQASHSQYLVKMYDKTMQARAQGFDVQDDLMRFELKYKKMEKMNKLGIYTLADIVLAGFAIFKEELINEFNNILLFDKTTKFEHRMLSSYRNPLFWTDLLENFSRKTFYKHKKQLNAFTRNSSDNLQGKIVKILSDKIDELANEGAQIDH